MQMLVLALADVEAQSLFFLRLFRANYRILRLMKVWPVLSERGSSASRRGLIASERGTKWRSVRP